jgi:hypothetical protein
MIPNGRSATHHDWTARMKWFERCFFPRGELLNFFIIAVLSGAMSFLLIGRQIYQANWGMIDDHEVFNFLGPRLHLPLTEIWSTLLAKTEVGSLQGRFRPGYYVFKLIETSLWGDNVHLWYLARALGFAIFLGSIWWFMRRFVGLWLSGIATAYMSLLPLWSDVWSRLGPSEIYGATCIGVMVLAAYLIFFSERLRTRNVSAVALALSTIALAGMKETFVPIAGGTLAVFILAGIKKQLSPLVIAILMLAILAAIGGIVFVVSKQVAAIGTDTYANSIEPWPVLAFAGNGLLFAVKKTWWVCATPMLFVVTLQAIQRKSHRSWIIASGIAICGYGFLVGMYAIQCALYRSEFPVHSRYDFPATLLVPLSFCVLACYVFYMMRFFFSGRTVNYAQLATAALLFVGLALGSSGRDHGKTIAAAVQTNIERTNAFYNELQRALRAAERSPESPIILEAYGAGAYEPVFSLMTYLPALGAKNRISVRLHPDEKSYGKLYDGLQLVLSNLEEAKNGVLTPLQDSLASRARGCISIAINGAPDAGCSGFQVKTF